ncbi:CusA/CzcA family heavy metal efflux RND transporter [Verrucomicrobiales bacterium BCK34]|nr:CusA/CzcA family heavy metal efflux RND transporter [Verrucomicrobiales bacterium BCK34]
MLDKLIQFALNQRFLFIVLTLVLLGAGVRAFSELSIDAFPDISNTQVQVIVTAPGMTPEEVEQRVTYPLETEVRGISGQTVLRSVTKYALSVVTIDFTDETDIYWARQQVNERISQVLAGLPDGVEGGLAPITVPLSDVYMFLVEGEGYSNMELRGVLDWIIRPRLLSVDGVADVNALGGEVKSFHVIPDPEKLRAFDLTISDVGEALELNNRNAGGDRFVRNDEILLVGTLGQLKSMEDIESVPVATRGENVILVKDIAVVELGALTRYGGVTANGKGEVVEGLVLNRRGANGRKTVDAVKTALEEVKPALPKGVKIVPFYDRSELINTAVSTVRNSLLQAVILVLVVLLLFLGNLRSAITVGAILPLTVLGAFLVMQKIGLSANLMSLGGIAIAVGILVDSAVVMVENIQSSLQGADREHRPGALLGAAKEVALPILSGVVIIVVSLSPILSLTGIEGKLFRPLAMTIAISMLVSLVLSLTVIPVLSSLLMKSGGGRDNFVIRGIKRLYAPALRLVLGNFKVAISIAVALLVVSAILGLRIGKEFLPFLDEGTLVVQFEKLPTISLAKSLEIDSRIEAEMLKLPEIKAVVSRVGSDELRLDPMSLNESDVFFVTAPRSEWPEPAMEALHAKLRGILDQFPGVAYGFTQPIDMRVSEMISGVSSAVAIKLSGDDFEVLDQKAREIESIVSGVEGAVDVQRTPLGGQLYLNIRLKHREMGRLGLSVEQVNALISKAVAGEAVTEIIEGNRRIPVLLRYPGHLRNSAAALKNLQVTTATGQRIFLSDIAELEEVDGPTAIDREDGKRVVVLESNVEGRDVVGFVTDVRTALGEKLELPPGYFIDLAGQFENQARASQRLAVVVPFALLAIFMVLLSTLGTARQAILILANIPFALIGGIVVLFFSGFYLSVPASVGFIALLGLAIMNGVVMVMFFNQLREEGKSIHESVVEGAQRRVRPVMMTAILTVLGLVPLLLASGPGSEIQKPLAAVVVGGTISSTILTLLLLPAMYRAIEERVERANPG